MYPTNYMNPMNNQPMSPDYGYNRMQQVQQMQQAINPTVPNMFGQMNQMNNMNQQQQTPYISAIPVTCLDEAKAARISLDGTLSVFINIQVIFGNDPNHFSLLCCVPNTVYTPPVVVPTEG